MTTSIRNQQTKEQIRTSIIDAALTLFLQEGDKHVSMRKIAEALPYSPTTIYHHFQNKEELLQELFFIGFAKFNRALRAVFYETFDQTAAQRLSAMLLAYIEFSLDEPHHHQLIFNTFMNRVMACMQNGPEEIDKESYEGMFLLIQTVKSLLSEKGRNVDGTPLEVATFLWMAVNGYTNMFIPLQQTTDREQVRHHALRFVKQVLHGVCH